MSENTEKNQPRSPLDGLDPLVVEQLSMATDEQLRFNADFAKFGVVFVLVPAAVTIIVACIGIYNFVLGLVTLTSGKDLKLIDLQGDGVTYLIENSVYDVGQNFIISAVAIPAVIFFYFITVAMKRGQSLSERLASHYKKNRKAGS